MKCIQFFLLLFVVFASAHSSSETKIQFTSKIGNACLYTRECSKDQYCSGNPAEKIYGNCEKRYSGFCQGGHQCDHSKSMGCILTNVNFGRCQKIDAPRTVSEDNSELNMFIPHLTKEEYDAIPYPSNQDLMDVEGAGSTCGNEHHDFGYDLMNEIKNSSSKDIKANCWTTGSCDEPAVRNTYTSAPNVILRVQWIVFKCGTWYQNAAAKIAEATYDLNQRFTTAGFTFNSYLSLYPCTGSTGNQDYNTISDSEATNAVTLERGSNWRNEGSLMVVAGTPTESLLNGFFYFPCSRAPCGSGFMNTRVVAKGYTTLSHELGHGFGLQHTFHGVSEISSCSSCRETVASDDTGDFCADTPPVVKNWDCKSPISANDPCNTQRTQWDPNPYKNIMSYGNCRDVFSECQKRRVRCYYSKSGSWLKKDATAQTSSVPTVSHGFSYTTCFGVSSTSSSVCSGNGKCVSKDVCQCYEFWIGSKCSTFSIFGAGNSIQVNIIGTIVFMLSIFAIIL